MEHLFGLILAGGGGTRLWPLSRRARPKQFLRVGDDTLLSATARRLLPLCAWDHICVVATEDQALAISAALPELPRQNLLLEPLGRNTAPAVGLGARRIVERDPDAVLAVLPADHWITEEEAFRKTVTQAVKAAAAGELVTCGLRPTRPETGYGYIELQKEFQPGLWKAARFVEKPDPKTAEKFLEGGRHLWNSGMFFFRADVILREIARCLPDLAALLDRLERESMKNLWASAPAVSIDVGVMEKVGGFTVVAGDFGWSDIGSFVSLPGARTDVLEVDARNNLVHGQGPLVALLGVHDLCVVVTADAVLICPKDRAQDVRVVVAELERRGRKDLL